MSQQLDHHGSLSNPFINEDQELKHTNPPRLREYTNEAYVNTRGLSNNLAISDKNDTLYRSPNAYQPDISENDIEKKLLGR
jgi:hypothetical protein